MTARNGVAPHRRLARAAWVLLALAGLAPAQAQVEDYISNVISTGTGNSNTEITISQSFAQTFRTGSQSGGYPLQEVVLRLDGLDTGTGAIRVTIRENSVVDGNNVPGMTRYTLTNPASLSSSNSGRNTFTAPSGATLVANTLYHVVAESTSGTAARWQRTTRRTMSVRPFGTDWDIGFDYLRQRADPPSWEVAASGRAFMVAVRGGDDGGGGNAAPTGVPTISDTTPMVGDTLTADASGISDPDGPASLTFTWRWLRVSGSTETPISGATSPTYTVVAADVGAKLKVEASFTDASGTAETVESAETDTVGEAPLPTVSVERVSSLVEEGAGGAVHGDAHGGDDGGADGPLRRVGERGHGGVGRGGREDPRFLGQHDQLDGDRADGGGHRPRGGQHGDGDADGGCGLRPGGPTPRQR